MLDLLGLSKTENTKKNSNEWIKNLLFWKSWEKKTEKFQNSAEDYYQTIEQTMTPTRKDTQESKSDFSFNINISNELFKKEVNQFILGKIEAK